MNELMSLKQLEKLAKNPSYKLSVKQLARLEELREKEYSTKKHSYSLKKHSTKINVRKPKVEEPEDGTSRN